MSLRGSRPVIHTMAGGFCAICGETAEWLTERGAEMVPRA